MRAFFFLFFCSAALLLPAGLKRSTRSFHLSRCIALAEGAGQIFSLFPQNKIREILSQPFSYLDRGAQSFVFASEDGRYVLKLFFFDREKHAAAKMLESCRTAVQAAEETALVYLHFGPSKESLPTVHLSGPAWHRTRLQSGRYCFALQMRAVPFKESLRNAYREKKRDVFLERIEAFYSLLHKRISKGILNSDPGLCGNFGFIEDGRAIEIDFGNYSRHRRLNRQMEDREIARYKKKLVKWASIAIPEWKEELETR